MKRIKKTLSRTLDIETEQLNEISLEDIEIEYASRYRIYTALHDIALQCDFHMTEPDPAETCSGVPCTGFWVEDTRELVLFAWSQYKTKTIVVPPEEWFLREDITVH